MSPSPAERFFHRVAVVAVGIMVLTVFTFWVDDPSRESSDRTTGPRPAPLPVVLLAQIAASTTAPAPQPVAVGAMPPPPPAEDTAPPAQWEAGLRSVPEIDLHPPGQMDRLFAKKIGGDDHPVLAVIDGRDDLRGLPVLRGAACQGPPIIGAVSRTLRSTLARNLSTFGVLVDKSTDWQHDVRSSLRRRVALDAELRPSLLWQMCECEAAHARAGVTDILSVIEKAEATQTLARVAVFDADSRVRRTAATALAKRAPSEYRPVLVAGLRHVWSTATVNAAAALEMLDDRDAVPDLVRLLDEPAPGAPAWGDAGTPVVRELVRVNHAKNCQLCHAPSWDIRDAARVGTPSASEPVPPPFSVEYYSPIRQESFVRADVTYLRQDFSRLMPVGNHGQWPERQRFDFLVRTRPATEAELAVPQPATYFQREVVLRTLQKLTGEKTGDDVAAWRDYARENYPPEG